MKVAILGYDTEGKVSYEYFKARGDEVTICDQETKLELPDDAPAVLGSAYLDDLDRFDLLVRTAGMPPRVILDKNPGVKDKITTQINEFLQICPTKNIIGVTGTKGKGTTSTLITKMLQADGKDVSVGGNIGVPALSLLNKLTNDSWVVLELSSFQLIDLRMSPRIAVCLMMVPEHLNWHADFEEYLTAKSQLFTHQHTEDIAIYYADSENSQRIASASPGHKIPYFSPPGACVENGAITINDQVVCHTDELKLLGAHNWQNVCAAVTAVWQVTQNIEAMRSVLTSFSGMEHRLELVRELDGVKYYDDSFGTTPETAIVAMQAFEQPKIVILGGSDKGASYAELAQSVATDNVRCAILIGE
ncbi:UDP-N-acetylmuramoyl-L-alanine--D-glutamate ligase [Candidatus Saccharibacteria bacterium]|nr:UDP-N-acetylmuramoyl-L-alanine--D-glutamate ligase [Candidatus Saccharibacteria bacterium]